MEDKLVNFIFELIKDSRSKEQIKRNLPLLLIPLFLTPLINGLIKDLNSFRDFCFKMTSWFSFENLPYNEKLLVIMCWFIFWIFIYLVIKFLLALVVKLWRYFEKNEYELSFRNWPKEWIIQGGVHLENHNENPQLEVAFSNSGALIKEKKWKDFEIKFELIFPKDNPNQESRVLGMIFRAKDLENYLMVQIMARRQKNEDYNIIVKPHIRYFGNWEVFDLQKEDMLGTIRHNSTTKSLKVCMQVKDLFANVFINNTHVYNWTIPSNTEVNLIQHGERLGNNSDNQKSKGKGGLVPEISFRNSYGKIGFRVYPGERAIVRNLKIKKI